MDIPFVTPKSMGEAIRRQIRTALHAKPGSTTAEIASMTGVSFPTISKTIDEMNEQHEVLLTGLATSSGGRRPKTYALNPEYRIGLTVYLEKDFIVYSVINYNGQLIERQRLPGVMTEGPDALTAQIAPFVQRYENLHTLTFGVPGAVNEGRSFYIPSFAAFKDFDFKSYYEGHFNKHVLVENDVNAAVVGYQDLLQAGKNESIVYVYFGRRALGAGILLNGEIVRGSTFFSGEISLLPLYDEKSLLQAVREPSLIVDALSRLVAIMVATINPSRVIFSGEQMDGLSLEDIVTRSGHYVPRSILPKLEPSEWEPDYLHGLQCLTVRNMLASGSVK
ncbi:ROK family transcriptional regulator [Paenibacillus sp. R14(2021)]|uniref:ROK family transcriptional regulator n=1 Tax=Paenibacillus sp. R14(2021) TaxID=2859228 RepID=UPI001C61485F|nr:ROK family transcriptional regulator [Paenibacillus sp. R14(2021)]